MSKRNKSLNLKEEQLLALSHEKGDVIISASAGSGKTFVMINRLVRLIVEKKTSVDRILAITFTESAAADMRRKLYEEILNEYKETKDKALRIELENVYTAEISTIHTFCSRLLRKYFYVSAISPDFKIGADDVSHALLNQAVEKVMKNAYREKDEKVLKVIKRHLKKRSDEEFRKILIELYYFAEGHANPEETLLKTVDKYSEENYLSILEAEKQEANFKASLIKKEILECETELNKLGEEKLISFAREIIREIEEFLALSPKTVGAKTFKIYAPKYNPKGEGGEIRERLLKLKDEFIKITKVTLNEVKFGEEEREQLSAMREHAEVVTFLVREIKKAYDELKREENLLDFNDLEHFALKVLEDEEVLNEIKSSYDYVCIDEYQDVNDVQEKLAQKIKSDNLFMVGDVKQSIYGFRGCRSDFFEEKFRKMQGDRKSAISLNYNFRSAEKVIEAVNTVFGYSMDKDFYGATYKGKSELALGGVYPNDKKGRAELIIISKNKAEKEFEEPRIYDVLEECQKADEQSFSATARMIKSVIDSELLNTYYDFKEEKDKQISYKDIAILCRNRSGEFVSEILRELTAHGVPVVSMAKEDLTAHKEIKVLIALLELIECFSQDIPLVSVLKSPIGDFSDEELAEISLFNKTEKGLKKPENFYKCFIYYLENAKTKLSEKAKAFKEYFDDIRYLSEFYSAKRIVTKVIEDKNVLAHYYATFSGEKKVKRIRSFISFLDSEGGKNSVAEVLYKIKNSKDGVPFCASSGEDAVSLLTMHSSKGLEYPVVIVCGLEKSFNFEDVKKEVYVDENFGFCFKSYDDKLKVSYNDKFRKIVKEKVKRERVKEETRLFYVALTRAKYSLYMIAHAEDERQGEFNGAKRYLELVPAYFPARHVSEDELKLLSLKKEPRKIIISKTDEEKVKEFSSRFSFKYPHEVDTELGLKTSVTGAMSLNLDEIYEKNYSEEFLDSELIKERGIIAHKFLELLDFDRLSQAKIQAKEMQEAGVIKAEDFEKIELDKIISSLSSPIIKELSGKKLYKEKSFLVKLPAREVTGQNTGSEILVQGVIDLLAVEGDEAIIIDYKYTSKKKEDIIKTYKKQLDLYAKATLKTLNLKVTKKAVLSLKTGEIVEID